VNCRQLKSVR